MRLVLPLCVAVCAFVAGSGAASAQRADPQPLLTEADALARMMAADPRVRAARARIDEVRAEQHERVRWPNPFVTFSREASAGLEDLFLTARQEVPLSGRRGHLRIAGSLAIDAADAMAASQIRDLQAALRRSFTTLLAAQERETVLRDSVDDLGHLVDILRLREEAGEGARYDRLRGQRALVDLESDLDASRIARARAQVELASLLGPSVAADSLVVSGSLHPDPPPPLPGLIDRALAVRADYRATQLTVTQHDAERRAAVALRVPTPTFGFGLKRSATTTAADSGSVFSVDVAVPLFNRGQSAVALATARAAQADAQRAFLRLRIETDVRDAHLALTMEQARAARYRESIVETAEPLAAIARLAYEEGELSILELLDANRQVTEARLRVLEMAAAARLAAIELDRVTGFEVTP
jgi:outer membrane protein, heavy metal efflux system